MRSITRAVVLVALALQVLAPASLAAAQRPISGWYTVAVVPTEPRCGPNAVTLGFEGTGNAAHLGRITGIGSNCTEPTLATSPVALWDGVATFVAADGSTLTVAYDGVQQAPIAGVATVTSYNTVIGGTGRFSEATGSWTASGGIDFSTGIYSGSFSGWIAY